MPRRPDIAPADPVLAMRLALIGLCRAAEEVASHDAALVDALVGVDAAGGAVDPVYHLAAAKLRIEDFIHEVLRRRDELVTATGTSAC